MRLISRALAAELCGVAACCGLAGSAAAATVVQATDSFYVISIPADLPGWQATGIALCPGSRWTLIVQGMANTGWAGSGEERWTSWTTSGGLLSAVPFNSPDVLVPDAPPYSLVARINGTPLYVGGGGRIDGHTGLLEVGYNDSNFADNVGFYVVHLTCDRDCVCPAGIADAPVPESPGLLAAPVPAFGEVSLRFDVPATEHYDVAIVDVQGRKVRQIYSGIWQAGRRLIHWDATDERGQRAAPGVYYATISSHSTLATQKLIVAK